MGSNDEHVMIDHFIMLKENFIGTIFNSAAIISNIGMDYCYLTLTEYPQQNLQNFLNENKYIWLTNIRSMIISFSFRRLFFSIYKRDAVPNLVLCICLKFGSINSQKMIKKYLLLLLLLSRFSRVRLCATPQTPAHQAPPSLGFSRQGHWSGLPFPSPMHESEK